MWRFISRKIIIKRSGVCSAQRAPWPTSLGKGKDPWIVFSKNQLNRFMGKEKNCRKQNEEKKLKRMKGFPPSLSWPKAFRMKTVYGFFYSWARERNPYPELLRSWIFPNPWFLITWKNWKGLCWSRWKGTVPLFFMTWRINELLAYSRTCMSWPIACWPIGKHFNWGRISWVQRPCNRSSIN